MKTRRSSPPHTGRFARLPALVLGLGLSLVTLGALPWQAPWAAEDTGTSPARAQAGQSADSKRPYVLGETLPKATPPKASADSGHSGKNPTDNSTDSRDDHNDHSASTQAAKQQGQDDTDPASYQPMDWEALIPPDWEPLKDFQTLDFSSMADNDPRAITALRKLQAAWKNAPLHPDIQREQIEISGFIIPLDSSTPGLIEELLLVPYFGACIHVPPPPSNQIIHVVLDEPLKGFQMMDPVTVRGELTPSRHDTPFGSAGYQLSARQIIAYEEPAELPLEEHP